MSVNDTINKLKSNWNFGYIDKTKMEFEELEELEKMNDKIEELEQALVDLLHESCKEYAENRAIIKELEYEKTQIRKQVCDEIREKLTFAKDLFAEGQIGIIKDILKIVEQETGEK